METFISISKNQPNHTKHVKRWHVYFQLAFNQSLKQYQNDTGGNI